jgi:hypothetical protein
LRLEVETTVQDLNQARAPNVALSIMEVLICRCKQKNDVVVISLGRETKDDDKGFIVDIRHRDLSLSTVSTDWNRIP